jgi:hypothetical protein
MRRSPQRSLLLFALIALGWGSALAALVWVGAAQPAPLLAVWAGGAALLVLLALYFGLALRLDVLQLQQTLRDAAADPGRATQARQTLAPIWWPLIDAVPPPGAQCDASLQARSAALESALAAARQQAQTWQRSAAQAQADLAALQRRVHAAAQALEHGQAIAAAPSPPEFPTDPPTAEVAPEMLRRLAAELSALAAQHAAIDAAQRQRAETTRQSAAGLREQAAALAQTVADLQLLGLNLRLQLTHLDAACLADPGWIAQTATDLDALLDRAAQLADAARAQSEALPELPAVPQPAADAEQTPLAQAVKRTSAALESAALALAAQRQDAENRRAAWQAELSQFRARYAALQQRLQELRALLQRAG